MAFGAVLELSSLDGTNGFKINGERRGDRAGQSVGSAGDVNGDGFDDLIIGAPYARSEDGASYVVFGKRGGFGETLNLSSLNGSNGFQFNGHRYSGFTVSSAGDLSGDGLDDVVIGSPQSRREVAYVVFGQTGGFNADFGPSALDGSNGFLVRGETASEEVVYSVASAGDVNGDGFDDVILGQPRADYHNGESSVIFGQDGGFPRVFQLASLNGANGFQIGSSQGERSGLSVASAGDVNGDGFDDVIVGEPLINDDEFSVGRAFVVFGKAEGFRAEIDRSNLNGANGFTLTGVAEGDEAGISVASAGDLNGDGFDDLIVGARDEDPSGGFSAAYVVFGKTGGFAAELDLSALDGQNGFRLTSEAGFASGRSVSSAGDVNGDGFDDVIVGAYAASSDGTLSGAAYTNGPHL